MKQYKGLAVILSLLLLVSFVACGPQTVTETPATEENQETTLAPSASEAEEERDYIIIPVEEEDLADELVPESAKDVKEIPEGFSYTSSMSFSSTVAYYQDLIESYGIEGRVDDVSEESLGVEQAWKFDGTYEEKLFSVSVAVNESGIVGVAVLY